MPTPTGLSQVTPARRMSINFTASTPVTRARIDGRVRDVTDILIMRIPASNRVNILASYMANGVKHQRRVSVRDFCTEADRLIIESAAREVCTN